MKLRVLIADDEALGRARLRELVRSEPNLQLVAECSDGREAVQAIRDKSPHVVFLDIRMPELDGFGVLEALRGHPVPAVIFVTAHHEFAVRAFEVHALDYLLKPFDRERFQTALRRARASIQLDAGTRSDQLLSAVMATLHNKRKVLERLPVKSHGRITVLNTADIDWICAAGNYVEVHVGKRSFLLRTQIKALAGQLCDSLFLQISRSHLVNVERIREVCSRAHGDYEIVLRDGTRLAGSRTFRQKLGRLLDATG